MPACASRSRRDPRDDERAVSEVIGFVLIFGILSMILVLAMVAFNEVHDRAEAAVVAVEGESVAQRVASAVVNAALFAERYGLDETSYLQALDLPAELEGNSYTVHLDPAVPGVSPAQVRVVVGAIAVETSAPLFSADASTDVTICSSSVAGGRVQVHLDPGAACPGISLVV